MKTYTAQPGSTLTLDNLGERTTVNLYSEEGFELLSNLWIKAATERRMMYEVNWLGRPVIQFPNDIVVMQELVWELKPDLIIECGVAHGGSLVLFASILELLGEGRVIGVDVEIRTHNRKALDEHFLRHRIELIEGSSVASDTFEAVRKSSENAKRVIVVLDSNHSTEHVRRELELYCTLVTPESYLIAQDGAQAWVWEIPRGKPDWKDDNPLAAIMAFLAEHPEFAVDDRRTRFGITSSPKGYLRRLPTSPR